MSVKATPTNQVFGNRFLNQAVLDFLPLQDQDRCKRINRVSNENAKALQRPRILENMPPIWVSLLKQERLENATIINFPTSAIHMPDYNSDETAGIEYIDLPASFVIGFAGKDIGYVAARVKNSIRGRYCGCIPLTMQGPQKNRVVYNYGTNNIRTDIDTHVYVLMQLLDGKTIETPAYTLTAHEPATYWCSLKRIASCFRRLCFETEPFCQAKVKLD